MTHATPPWPIKLLRYLASAVIVVAFTLVLTGLFCGWMGWTSPLLYGKALFWASLVVILMGVWRFFGRTGAPGVLSAGGWEQAYGSYHPFQLVAGLWHDIHRGFDFVVFAAVSGLIVMAIALVLVSRFTSCLWCTLF